MPEKYLIIGLGNPGRRYAATRHNLGAMFTDHLAERFKESFRSGKGEYLICGPLRGAETPHELVLIKPVTYMNNSGVAVQQAVHYFQFDLDHILVVLDDFQLPFGKLRLRPKGSDGGHNGLHSIIQSLGSEDFPRLRLGIGSEFQGDAVHHVLANFSKAELESLPALMDTAADAIVDFASNGIQHAMNKYN